MFKIVPPDQWAVNRVVEPNQEEQRRKMGVYRKWYEFTRYRGAQYIEYLAVPTFPLEGDRAYDALEARYVSKTSTTLFPKPKAMFGVVVDEQYGAQTFTNGFLY
ncbi:hypothetical protein QFC20_001192 [Naganishia adeliensis]|uniref:Uncharacterized protein n=1 Tax=Naganishia adeliensis TaxID=92952 RepID=A0ACC2WVI1_9TREE|nr:hypothetical protein QFC20_001192 [Naganishia adeliensis]